MKITLPKYYDGTLKYDKVPSYFEGTLTYIADFDCGGYLPAAVWSNSTPNRDKNHKDFLLLYRQGGLFYVNGKDKDEIQKYLNRPAAHCKVCDTVIYSVYRHDARNCECKSITVDGGHDYLKVNFGLGAYYITGILNLETKEFKEYEKDTSATDLK